jgi:hypothetical protein
MARKPRLTYANVVSTLALFLALGGGAALAASRIHSADIAPGAIHAANLHKRAVSSGKLALGAVRSNQIADGAVSSAQIGAGSVAPSNLQVPLFFVATPSGGSTAVPSSGAPVVYPIANPNWTQKPGQLNVIFGAGTATLAYDPSSGEGACQVGMEVSIKGEGENGESGGQFSTASTTPVQVETNLGGVPEMDPTSATTRHLRARIGSNGGCIEGSTIDSTRFTVVDFG